MKEWSSTGAAAELGVSTQRIRALARAGMLDARKVGGRWLLASLPDKDRRARAGRPLSAASAWALLAELSHMPPRWIHASARSRLRGRLTEPEWVLEALLRSQLRFRVVKWRVLPADLQRIRGKEGLVKTGLSAVSTEIDIVPAAALLDAYVDRETLGLIQKRYRPDTSPAEVNLILRVPSHPWILSFNVAPPAVAAADLLMSSDPRTVRAARESIRKLIHD